MPFCRNCGAEVVEGGKFCAKCGTPMDAQPMEGVTPQQPQEPVSPMPEVTPQQPQEAAQPMYGTPQQPMYGAPQQPMYGAPQQPQPKPKKPFNFKLLIILVAAALVVAGAIIAVVNIVIYQKSKIDIGDYVEVSFEGYDTMGKAYADISDDFYKKVLKMHGYDYEDEDDLEDLYDNRKLYKKLDKFFTSIELKIDESTDLSNGDKVVVTVIYDEDYMKDCKIHLKNTKVEFTVEDLEAIQDVNPFDDITLEFYGTAPEGYVYYNCTSANDYVRYSSFSFDKDSGLSNGDKITLTVSEDSVDYALRNGYRFTETSKEYTVEGVAYYISSLSDIADSDLETIKKDAEEEIIDAYEWKDDYATISGLTYEGTMLGINNDESSYTSNVLVVVYSAKLTSVDGDFDPTQIYIPVEIDNVRYDNEGAISYGYASTFGTIDVEDQYYTLIGYVKGSVLYEGVVIANDSYDWELSDELPEDIAADSSKDDTKEDTDKKDTDKEETEEGGYDGE